MSEDKKTETDSGSGAGRATSLETAMREAVEAVERRETMPTSAGRAYLEMREAMESADRREKAHDADGGAEKPHQSASEAVTEALLKAKRELEEALEQTKKEAQHFNERWLRAAADLENYRRRAVREQDDARKFANEKLLKDFLPVVDDLERAVNAFGSGPEEGGARTAEGVRMVQRKFISALEKHGVTTFEAEGEVFDPGLHEAVQQLHSDVPAGKVVTQLQRGFMINDRLLRPALVVVSLGQASEGSS